MTRRICGIPITRSIHHEITASAFLPSTAAAVPARSAMTALTAAVRTPMRMLRDSPARVRASMSRPIQSVPNRCPGPGARLVRVKSVSVARPSSRIPAAVTAARIRTAAARKRSVLFRRLDSFPYGFSAFLSGLPFLTSGCIFCVFPKCLIPALPSFLSSGPQRRRASPRSDYP